MGLGPEILRGRLYRCAKRRSGVPGPARIPQRSAGYRYGVGLPVFEDALRLVRIGDHSDRHDRHGDRVLDRPRQRHLIAGTDRDLLAWVEAAALGTDNLVPPILDAVKAHATHGELCNVLREVYGTYHPDSLTTGV